MDINRNPIKKIENLKIDYSRVMFFQINNITIMQIPISANYKILERYIIKDNSILLSFRCYNGYTMYYDKCNNNLIVLDKSIDNDNKQLECYLINLDNLYVSNKKNINTYELVKKYTHIHRFDISSK